MVEYSVVAVTALKSAVVCSVGVLVELNAEINDMLNILRCLAYKGVDSVYIVLETACDEGIVLVVLDIILGRIVNARNSALSKRGVAKAEFLFANHEYLCV